MTTPLSLRIARTLLALAGGLVAATVFFITAASQDRISALPWLALLALNAAGFFGAWWLLPRDPTRGKTLAVGSAIGMAGLGIITGFGAGMLSFPAAAVGALAAWAALLHRPTRRMWIALGVYLVIGVAVTLATPGSVASIFVLVFLFVWPARLLLFPGTGLLSIFVLLGLALGVVLLVFARRRAFSGPIAPRAWVAAAALSIVLGIVAVALFVAYANARPSTSARFDLTDPVVLGVVFAGAWLATYGVLAIRFGRPIGAFALGLGAMALFMTFSARPAATCEVNGTSTGVPLAWSIRGAFDPAASSMLGSGSSGTVGADGQRSISSGEITSGSRVARYSCDGDRLVEYREEAR